MKPQPTAVFDGNRLYVATSSGRSKPIPCPYGRTGDVLWVRETWRMPDTFDGDSPTQARERVDRSRSPNVFYEADQTVRSAGAYTGHPGKTRVSIHMPRWASRLSLRITDVRVERLNEISEADCQSEGVGNPYFGDGDPPFEERGVTVSRWMQYRNLWNKINGPGSWAANPWVWAVSFEVIE